MVGRTTVPGGPRHLPAGLQMIRPPYVVAVTAAVVSGARIRIGAGRNRCLTRLSSSSTNLETFACRSRAEAGFGVDGASGKARRISLWSFSWRTPLHINVRRHHVRGPEGGAAAGADHHAHPH